MGSPLMVMGMPPTMTESPPAAPPAAPKPAAPQPAGPKKKIEVHMVYADWCGHCVRFKPTYEYLTDIFNKLYNNRCSCGCYSFAKSSSFLIDVKFPSTPAILSRLL